MVATIINIGIIVNIDTIVAIIVHLVILVVGVTSIDITMYILMIMIITTLL